MLLQGWAVHGPCSNPPPTPSPHINVPRWTQRLSAFVDQDTGELAPSYWAAPAALTSGLGSRPKASLPRGGASPGPLPRPELSPRLLCARRKIPAPGLRLGLRPTDIFPFGTELGMRSKSRGKLAFHPNRLWKHTLDSTHHLPGRFQPLKRSDSVQ